MGLLDLISRLFPSHPKMQMGLCADCCGSDGCSKCADGAAQQCANGAAATCVSGTWVCADGSTPNCCKCSCATGTPSCADGDVPACADGSAPRCVGGVCVCDDGSNPTDSGNHPGPGGACSACSARVPEFVLVEIHAAIAGGLSDGGVCDSSCVEIRNATFLLTQEMPGGCCWSGTWTNGACDFTLRLCVSLFNDSCSGGVGSNYLHSYRLALSVGVTGGFFAHDVYVWTDPQNAPIAYPPDCTIQRTLVDCTNQYLLNNPSSVCQMDKDGLVTTDSTAIITPLP